MSISAGSLRCEHLENPVGVDFTAPRLSWKLSAEKEARGTVQSAYRIQAGSMPGMADLWDTDRVEGDQSVLVAWGGPKLASRQRVWWRVKVWDGDGKASKWSDDACFEIGLRNAPDWRAARWIGGPLVGGPHTSVPLPKLTRTFTPASPVANARLYITALGIYEASLNGKRLGDAELAPGWTDYAKRVRYQTLDVTKSLAKGENVLSVELGDGWAGGQIGWRERANYAERPKLLAVLYLTHNDGTTSVVRTDEKWQVAYGPRLTADLLMGEHFDARLPWTTVGAASVFPAPEGLTLDGQNGPPVKVTEELKPACAPYRHGGSWIFDLGINLVGRVRLKVKGAAGTTIKLRYAEVLEKGPLAEGGPIYTANLRAAANTDYCTLSGNPDGEVFETRFTFHGFRYVEVSGFPGEPTEEAVTGVVLHSEAKVTGSFECSDPLVNQLQKNIDWGWRGNSVDLPTDCPQRDERLGWTGDAQVFCRTACFLRETASFWHKWMGDMRDAQGPRGEFPPVAPYFAGALPQDGGPAWADAGIIVPWTVYLTYGDTKILTDNYDAMRRFIEFLTSTTKDGVRCYPGYDGFMGFGDWLALDGSGKTDGGTPKDLIGTAYLAYSARLLGKIASVLGKKQDAHKYSLLFDRTKAVFLKRYVTPDGLIAPMTQTAGILALHFDLLPENLRPKVLEWVIRDIESRGGKTSTGFAGSSYVPHVLSAEKKLDTAAKLLFQKGWPSYLYAVTMGATTIWERWDGWTAEKGFQDPGMNSFNHYAYGAVGSWLYQRVAGIDLAEDGPGYKKLVFQPQLLDGLTHARASLETPYGLAESAWEKKKKSVVWKVVVPPNTTATAYLPGSGATEGGKSLEKAVGVTVVSPGVVELGSGTYAFEVMGKHS